MADASQPISIEHLIAHLRSDDPRLYEALIMISRGRGVTIPIGSVSGMDEVIAPLELPLTTKGDLLTRDANGLTRVGIKGTREGYVPTVDIRSEAGWSWQAPVSSPVGALTIDILKAAALIGTCDELNFTGSFSRIYRPLSAGLDIIKKYLVCLPGIVADSQPLAFTGSQAATSFVQFRSFFLEIGGQQVVIVISIDQVDALQLAVPG